MGEISTTLLPRKVSRERNHYTKGEEGGHPACLPGGTAVKASLLVLIGHFFFPRSESPACCLYVDRSTTRTTATEGGGDAPAW